MTHTSTPPEGRAPTVPGLRRLLGTLSLSALAATGSLLMSPSAAAMTTAEYDAAIALCDPIAGDKQALCIERANQQRDIDARSARRASGVVPPRRRAEGYYVDMAKCRKRVADPRALCTETARQKWPLINVADTTPKDAAGRERAAKYAAAMKKCDPIAGDKRALCTEAAQQDFGPKP